PFIVNMSSGWIAKLGDTGSTAIRPTAKPMRFDAFWMKVLVSVARLAPPMMPRRGVDCERDGVQAVAARAAFRNRSRGRTMRLVSWLGRATCSAQRPISAARGPHKSDAEGITI